MLEGWDNLTHVVVMNLFMLHLFQSWDNQYPKGSKKRMFYNHAILPPLDLEKENSAPSGSEPDHSLSHVILDHIFLSHYGQECDYY